MTTDQSSIAGRRLRLSLAILAFSPLCAAAGTLEVTLAHDASKGGTVGCALFAETDAENFPTANSGTQAMRQPANAQGLTCVFDELAPGRYAIAASQDLNGNEKTDTNFVGKPKEPWGVSNDVRPTFRAPRFDEAAFSVPADGVTRVTVKVR